MPQPFRTNLHSLCSTGANAQTKQRYAQQSNVSAGRQTCRLCSWQQFQVRCGDVRVPAVSHAPMRLTRRDNGCRPRFSSTVHVQFSSPTTTLWHLSGPEYRLHALALRAASQAYQSEYAFFCRLFSWRHRSRAAPFFGCLDGLTIQDGGTGCELSSGRTAYLFAQGFVNARPTAVLAPVTKVGVDSFPGW